MCARSFVFRLHKWWTLQDLMLILIIAHLLTLSSGPFSNFRFLLFHLCLSRLWAAQYYYIFILLLCLHALDHKDIYQRFPCRYNTLFYFFCSLFRLWSSFCNYTIIIDHLREKKKGFPFLVVWWKINYSLNCILCVKTNLTRLTHR